MYVCVCVSVQPTLSVTVGHSIKKAKRMATTGRMQRKAVSRIVSHTFGWLREFLAVPVGGDTHCDRGGMDGGGGARGLEMAEGSDCDSVVGYRQTGS